MAQETKCRGCGAPIVFVKTVAGKSMPCDPCRVPFWIKQGGSKKILTMSGEVVSCELNGPRATVSGFGYVSHFGTCPQANNFRKK